MNKLLISVTGAAALLFSTLSVAGQSQDIGSLEVHYSAFSSTFITPEIAKNYGIKRSAYSALINISVLDKTQNGKPALVSTLSGTARNLLGNTKQLEFREVREGDAIYYLAEFSFSNEEDYRFKIDVSSEGNRSGTLNFRQKFYVED